MPTHLNPKLDCLTKGRATSPGKEVVRMATRRIARDGRNGKFIPVKVAQNRKATAVVEAIKVKKPK